MLFISDYLKDKLATGMTNKDIANELDLTVAMVGQYRLKRGYNASLSTAKKVYTIDEVVLHPFSEESLKYEINKDK